MNQMRILLADDDSEDRDFFKEALLEIIPSAHLSTVNNGKEATEFLENCALIDLPCSILIDYNMPRMNGPELLDWLCSRIKFNGIDKIVWSTAYDKKYVDDCISKGAIEYFRKANDYEGVKSIVQKILAHCKYHPDIEIMPQA